MKNLGCIIMLASLTALTGCYKDKNEERKHSGLPPCSFTAAQIYTGAIVQGTCRTFSPCTNHWQDVTVTGDFSSRDNIHPFLCRGVDCVLSPVPALPCAATTPGDTTTPCQTTTPSIDIISIPPHVLSFQNAFEEGYTSYVITEQLCQ